MIKSPANALENINSPRKFPNTKKKSRQIHPKRIQKEKVLLTVAFRESRCPEACDSETAGRSIKEMEPVSALGNKIKGNDSHACILLIRIYEKQSRAITLPWQIIRAIIPDGVKIIELGNLEEIKEAIPDYKQIFPDD